jgi:hypothetical protein
MVHIHLSFCVGTLAIDRTDLSQSCLVVSGRHVDGVVGPFRFSSVTAQSSGILRGTRNGRHVDGVISTVVLSLLSSDERHSTLLGGHQVREAPRLPEVRMVRNGLP